MYVYEMNSFYARPDTLGEQHDADLATGRLHYFAHGPADGPVVLFVHGLLVNADLWRKVVPIVAASGFHTLAVDWPLGSHRAPMPEADFSPTGVAGLIASFMDELELTDVTVVANDTGGALTQILMTRHPERIGRVVLTPSDSFEIFFPTMFWPLPVLARIPGGTKLLVALLQLRFVRRLPMAFGRLSRRRVPDAVLESYVRPSREDAAIRRDLRSFLRQVDRKHTLRAAEQLDVFTKPVLLAWSIEDRLFPIALAERLTKILPNARISPIRDALTFVPEDQPEVLANLITSFVRDVAS